MVTNRLRADDDPADWIIPINLGKKVELTQLIPMVYSKYIGDSEFKLSSQSKKMSGSEYPALMTRTTPSVLAETQNTGIRLINRMD